MKVYCVNGPCKGEVVQMPDNTVDMGIHKTHIPNVRTIVCTRHVYKISARVNENGESLAFHESSQPEGYYV